MTQRNNATARPIVSELLAKRMLLGAGLALALISLFLLKAGEPDPAWGSLWRLRPLIIMPLAGATGGACYHVLHHLSYQGGWRRVLANILGLIIFVVGLWMGFVLGLDGTYWH